MRHLHLIMSSLFSTTTHTTTHTSSQSSISSCKHISNPLGLIILQWRSQTRVDTLIGAARPGEDQERSQLSKQKVPIVVRIYCALKLSPVCLLYTAVTESRHCYFLKAGWVGTCFYYQSASFNQTKATLHNTVYFFKSNLKYYTA